VQQRRKVQGVGVALARVLILRDRERRDRERQTTLRRRRTSRTRCAWSSVKIVCDVMPTSRPIKSSRTPCAEPSWPRAGTRALTATVAVANHKSTNRSTIASNGRSPKAAKGCSKSGRAPLDARPQRRIDRRGSFSDKKGPAKPLVGPRGGVRASWPGGAPSCGEA
jgi:hypothetical protein